MCLKVLAVAGIFIFAQIIQASPAKKTSPVDAQWLSDEQRLINARRENEEAQAKYYTVLKESSECRWSHRSYSSSLLGCNCGFAHALC
jgi:hypothetical protein